ncbi:MAG: zf-TFIIB domain-containing protein [Halioglobus sp.]
MKCPKCNEAMLPVEFGTDIKIARCMGCHGIYCDRQVLDQMRGESLIDTVLDIGCALEGARHNAMADIPCPGCGATMDQVQDKEQTHITLDACPSCEGIYLDGGELTDLKNVTLMDHLRGLLKVFDK